MNVGPPHLSRLNRSRSAALTMGSSGKPEGSVIGNDASNLLKISEGTQAAHSQLMVLVELVDVFELAVATVRNSRLGDLG